MHFENRAIVPASRETLWQFLMDVPSVGGCVPRKVSIHGSPGAGSRRVETPICSLFRQLRSAHDERREIQEI